MILSTMGGPRGGGAKLTPWGEELIERFAAIEEATESVIAHHLQELEVRAVSSGGPAARTRGRSKAR